LISLSALKTLEKRLIHSFFNRKSKSATLKIAFPALSSFDLPFALNTSSFHFPFSSSSRACLLSSFDFPFYLVLISLNIKFSFPQTSSFDFTFYLVLISWWTLGELLSTDLWDILRLNGAKYLVLISLIYSFDFPFTEKHLVFISLPATFHFFRRPKPV
jgi:hypothetical protein